MPDSEQKTVEALNLAMDQGLVDELDTALIFYDHGKLASQVDRVRAAFPGDAAHAIAVKTNPLACVLRKATKLQLYAEAASFEELVLAHHFGFGNRLIWDSPAKTATEVDQCASMNPYLVNLNSLEELGLYRHLDQIRLGLRVNPEIRADAISSLAVGQRSSKFGIPISMRESIISACIADARISALHVHSSSSPRSLEPLVEGVARVVALAEEINQRCSMQGLERRIRMIDIGGGLPLAIPEDRSLGVERYAELLRHRSPQLFAGGYTVVTEFGRYYHYASGWTASRIHSVQEDREVPNVIVHVGADSFVREVYDPDNWTLQFTAGTRRLENGPRINYRICGPLCFEGDVIGRMVELPRVEAGDWLIALATGANTYSLWSRHCSRALPKVILFDSSSSTVSLGKPRESLEDIVAFWS